MNITYQQLISDLMVLTGAAAALLSILLVIIALAQTRAPRGGALAFVLGFGLLAAGAYLSTQPVMPTFVLDAWQRVTSSKPEPGPAPVVVPPEATVPEPVETIE